MAREREAIVRALRLGGTAPGSLAPIPDLCDANLRGCARPRSEVDVRGERSMRSQRLPSSTITFFFYHLHSRTLCQWFSQNPLNLIYIGIQRSALISAHGGGKRRTSARTEAGSAARASHLTALLTTPARVL